MNKVAIKPLSIAYRLLNPGSVVLISVADGERDNIFPVTWNMPVKKNPSMVAVLCGKGHFSYPFIERTHELGINVPDAGLVNAVYGCGTTSGRDVPDKFKRFGLNRQQAKHIKAPLVAEAVANMECRVTQFIDLGTSSLIIAEILDAVAATEHFVDENWTFDNGLRLIHHLSGNRFCVSERNVFA